MSSFTSQLTADIAPLRRRESTTEAMIRQIDEKLLRLNTARAERAVALNNIRCELARALLAEQAASERNETASGSD